MKSTKAKDIISKSGFVKISPQTTISSVYSQLKSTHDAVFVFDEDKYLGLVNLYYSLLKKRPPAKAKVYSFLYHPPKIDFETPIPEIARLMVESRVYELPVFSPEGNFAGVVLAKKILRWALSLPEVAKPIVDYFPARFPITIGFRSGINKARSLMFVNHVNRLLVTNDQRKIIGIISTYDLRAPFSSPRETIHFMSRTPIKKEFGAIPVEKFMNRGLEILEKSQSLKEAIRIMVEKDIGSVFIRESSTNNKPYRLLTNRDLLKFIWQIKRKAKETNILGTFKLPLSTGDKKFFINRLKSIIAKNPILSKKIKDISLVFDALSKKSVIKPIIKVRIQSKTYKNELLSTKAKGKNIFSIIKQLTRRLERQLGKK